MDLSRRLMQVASLVTMPLAALVAGAAIFHDDGAPSSGLIRLSAAAFVITVGLAGWMIGARGPRFARRLPYASLGLVWLSASGSVWTLHLGWKTGDSELWAVGLTLLLSVQGFVTVTHLWGRFACRPDPRPS